MLLIFSTRRGVLVFLRFFKPEILLVQTMFRPKSESVKLPCEIIFSERVKLFDHALRLVNDFLTSKKVFLTEWHI